MNESSTHYRNAVIHTLYKRVLKPIFFHQDPEEVHDRMTAVGVWFSHYRLGRMLTSALFAYEHPILEQEVLGITFKNPIGLSAGFDKNAELTDILPAVGFGFAEVGSITGEYCPGNPKPRLWRMKNSQGLVVYYGLKNDGCETIAERLQGKHFAIPIGVSVAMTNCEATMDIATAIADYAKAFNVMEPIGDYVTVNISCPNTVGGQPFINPEHLDRLFVTLDAIPTKKPIFIKLSPDLTETALDELLAVLKKHRVHGIICTNLTKKRNNPHIQDDDVSEKGGMSGKVVQELSDDMLAHIYKKAGNHFVLIGSGGVFTAEDAYRKIKLGASLIQMITGMIFEGPQVISQINQGLVALLKRDGFANISEAIGVDNKL